MRRRRPGILTELVPVGLILGCLGGTLALVLMVHARAGRVASRPSSPVPIAVTPIEPPPRPPELAAPQSDRAKPAVAALPSPPRPPVEDPTKKELARLAGSVAAETAATRAADRRAEALEAARRGAVAESEKWRLRESIIRAQVDTLNATADSIERTQDALAAERDALVKQRDQARAALTRAQASGGGYAVLPHKAQNGTWQRPVVIECRNGMAILRPRNLPFTMLEMSPLMGLRGSPLVGAVARELIKVQDVTSPDGAPIVPYIYFIVRPDGIRPYYEARARLEPLGIAFGYELVDQDWVIDFPDAHTWDNATTALAGAGAGAPAAASNRDGAGTSGGTRAPGFAWPADRGGQSPAAAPGVEPFLWPRTASGTGPGGPNAPGAGPRGDGNGSGRDGDGRDPIVLPGLGAKPGGGLGSFGDDVIVKNQGQPGGPGNPGPLEGAPAGVPLPGPRGNPGPGAPGLSPLRPGALPGFDAAEPGGAATPGRASSFAAGDPTRDGVRDTPPRVPRGVPGALPRNLTADQLRALRQLAEAGALGSANTPRPDGRVRLDPQWLAQLSQAADEEDGDRPALPPTGLRNRLKEADTHRGDAEPIAGRAPGSRLGQGGAGSPFQSSAPAGGMPAGAAGGVAGAAGGAASAEAGVPLPSPGGTASRPPEGLSPRPPTAMPSRANPGPITVPLNLTVACGAEGVVIHPGGYRLSASVLRKEKGLLRHLETIVVNHAVIDPSVRPAPRLEFLVEPGGAAIYEEARRQTVLSGLTWPVTIRVAETGGVRLHARERF